MSLRKEFQEFILRGNVIDMSVGIIVGAAFGKIVDSLVKDIIMPFLGLILGKIDFSNLFITLKEGNVAAPYHTLAAAQTAGAITVNIGLFINICLNLLIVGFAIFMMVKGINTLRREKASEPDTVITKECGYCFSKVDIKATRCPFCTSSLE